LLINSPATSRLVENDEGPAQLTFFLSVWLIVIDGLQADYDDDDDDVLLLWLTACLSDIALTFDS
jgi:hypothetical protein